MAVRLSHKAGMETNANQIIDALGGTTVVARMLELPVSTVHSWRKIGIPKTRMAHIRLAARDNGKTIPEAS